MDMNLSKLWEIVEESGVPSSMGLQGVGHDLATEQQWSRRVESSDKDRNSRYIPGNEQDVGSQKMEQCPAYLRNETSHGWLDCGGKMGLRVGGLESHKPKVEAMNLIGVGFEKPLQNDQTSVIQAV